LGFFLPYIFLSPLDINDEKEDLFSI